MARASSSRCRGGTMRPVGRWAILRPYLSRAILLIEYHNRLATVYTLKHGPESLSTGSDGMNNSRLSGTVYQECSVLRLARHKPRHTPASGSKANTLLAGTIECTEASPVRRIRWVTSAASTTPIREHHHARRNIVMLGFDLTIGHRLETETSRVAATGMQMKWALHVQLAEVFLTVERHQEASRNTLGGHKTNDVEVLTLF